MASLGRVDRLPKPQLALPPGGAPKVVTSRRRVRHFFVRWVSRTQLIHIDARF